jgi:hypothetical protein
MNFDWVKNIAGPLRARTFVDFCRLVQANKPKFILETGCIRDEREDGPDGQSTLILAALAKEIGASLFSVDLDLDHIDVSLRRLKNAGLEEKVTFVNKDSVAFLEGSPHIFGAVYLDSFDFKPHDPLPSQIHQLNEVKLAYASSKQVIMMDDCNLPFGGKAFLAKKWLSQNNFVEIADDYQSIFTNYWPLCFEDCKVKSS